MIGDRVVWIEGVFCPICWNEGPHERIEVDPYGQFLMMRCANKNCGAESRVQG